MQNFLNLYLACKHQQLNGPVSYWGFRETGPWGPFLESLDNLSCPKRCFMFAVFAFKIKVSLIIGMIQWTYHDQLTKQNWLVCELGTTLLFNRSWFQSLPTDPNSYRTFRDLYKPHASPLSALSFKFVRISAQSVELLKKKKKRMVWTEKGSLPVALFRNGRMEEITDNQLFQILSAHFCFLFPTPRSVRYFQLHVL